MKRVGALLALLLAAAAAPPVDAGHGVDAHSPNMRLVASWDHGGKYREGTDLAFWGDLAVLGNYDNPGGFRLLDVGDPARPRFVGQLVCPGPQNDVSVWRDLVFLSVDSPRASAKCGAGPASNDQVLAGAAWEGIRVVSIADPRRPVQIAAVKTDCGSHTHTLVPDLARGRVLIYALSYPLSPTAQGQDCNPLAHRKFSVVAVPLANPRKARVVSTPDVSPAIGCHDVTVFMPGKIAAAACITETQMWDISDPVSPEVIAHVYNPLANIHHSTTFSWSGQTLVIGDELGGAAASPGCLTGGHAPLGALWFMDVRDPRSPQLVGFYQIPQQETSIFCTAHNFNAVPLRSTRDLLVSAWYNGGTTVVDFTDPGSPTQVGFHIPKEPAIANAWSSYWYNGFIYTNNFDEQIEGGERSRGFDVLAIRDSFVRDAVRLPYLNPQTMAAVPGIRAKAARESGY